MKSIHRSILTRTLMTGVASLAFAMVSAGGVRAEIVIVQGDDSAAGADGVNPGDPGFQGGDGESVTAGAGSTQPITARRSGSPPRDIMHAMLRDGTEFAPA